MPACLETFRLKTIIVFPSVLAESPQDARTVRIASSGVTWSRLAVTVSPRLPENTRFRPVISAKARRISSAGASFTWRLKFRSSEIIFFSPASIGSAGDGKTPAASSFATVSWTGESISISPESRDAAEDELIETHAKGHSKKLCPPFSLMCAKEQCAGGRGKNHCFS